METIPLFIIAAAPHRLLFFVGATNVLLAMAWWTLWLLQSRWPLLELAQPSIPAGWLHAFLMQYQVLPAFIFGFLLTVFPRWTDQQALSRRHYVPVGLGLLGGQLATVLGALGSLALLQAGTLLALAGWSYGAVQLWRIVWRDAAKTAHAVSCLAAISFGWAGLLLHAAFLYSGDAWMTFGSIKLGTFALLLPIFFTVCHRMVPFFSSSVMKDYPVFRPMWMLGAFWAATLVHLALELRHGYQWLWIPDTGITLLSAWLLWQWWPRKQTMPALLRVLYLGFAWLPLAFALYSFQSLWFLLTDEFLLGRAPAHVLFVGMFGSLLVAMVTRVTQGHSGRPLVLGSVAAFAFATLQLVVIVRALAEVMKDPLAWQIAAGAGWLLAFLPWVLRSGSIYLARRVDGKPG